MAKRLRLSHIAYIRSQFGSQLADTLQQLEDAHNSVASQTTASSQGTTDPPPKISSLTVSSANGVFEIAIIDNSAVVRGINYFVEYSSTPAFSTPKVLDLGASRNFRTFLDSGAYYFRAYSAYPTSARSQPVYFGTQTNPTLVNGGGAIAGPAALPSQGSGTSIGANGGDGGFGNEPERDISGRFLTL